jgi:hypothetical protein
MRHMRWILKNADLASSSVKIIKTTFLSAIEIRNAFYVERVNLYDSKLT